MRDQILALIEPKVRELAEQLTEQIVARVAVMVGQLEFAFEAAASSFESDLARGDTYLGGEGADAAPKQTPPSTSTAPSRPSGDSGRAAAPARTDGKRTNTCRKCGAVGFTARTCGKTHNVSTSPATDADTASTPSREKAASSPATPNPLRSATPEPARAQRREVLRERAEALRDAPPQRSPWLEPDEEELVLPTPLTSFNISRDVVRGVDEPQRGRRGRPRLSETLTPEQLEAHRARAKERAKERAKQRRVAAAAPALESANP